MARTLTHQDCHAILNTIASQVTGASGLTATDTSSFVSVGEKVLATGTENVMNTISMMELKTLIDARPYSGKLQLINSTNSGIYSNRIRKISFYSRPALDDGRTNNNLHKNLAAGYDNGKQGSGTNASVASMWEQHPAVALERNFAGSSVWQDCLTRYENQLQQAFRSEADFASFISGIMTEKQSDIEQEKENFRRLTLLNAMAANHELGLSVNLTEKYNTFYGLSGSSAKTTAQLLSTDLTSFLEFLAAEIKILSKRMTYRTADHHWSPTRADNLQLLRHTPMNKQKLFLYEPLMARARAQVLPEIFNPSYLDIKNYEGVDFWQSYDEPMKMSITPAVPKADGTTQQAGSAVALNNVIGFLFDTDALMVDFQLDSVKSTPVEARKHYVNTWYSMQRNAINDPTENAILLYMADPAS